MLVSGERKSPPCVNLEVMHRWKMKIVAFWVAEKVMWCKGKVNLYSEVCLTGLKRAILPKFWRFFSSWICCPSPTDWKFRDFKEGSNVFFWFWFFFMLKRERVYFYRFLLGAWVTPSLLNRLILGSSKILIYIVIFEKKNKDLFLDNDLLTSDCVRVSVPPCAAVLHSLILISSQDTMLGL